MSTITSIETYDIRFPTSVTKDGSDAMNKDADYSAAYVTVFTDEPTSDGSLLAGYGLTFTIGRGNDLVVEAARQQAGTLVGRDLDAAVADMGALYSDLTLRLAAALARSREGRRASVARSRAQRLLGPGRETRRAAPLATDRGDGRRTDRGRRRHALPLRRHLAGGGAGAPSPEQPPARSKRIEELAPPRLPRVHHEPGLAGVLRRQAASTVRGGRRAGVSGRQAEGREPRTSRTTSVGAASLGRCWARTSS